MSLTGKDIGKLRSLYESVYEPKEEETELMTEETYKECLEAVIIEAIDQSGLLDIEFEDEELQMRLIEEVLSENFLKNQIKKVVTTKAGRESIKKFGMDALKATGVTAGVGGVIDTAVKDDVSGKTNMGLRTASSFLKNLGPNLRAAYTTAQTGAKDTGNKVIDITGTGSARNPDIGKYTNEKGQLLTTTKEIQKDNKKIVDKIRNNRNMNK